MDVPIYHAKFGPLKKKNKNFTGLVSSNEGSFGIFLPIEFNIVVISHEVFHLTHKILEYHNISFEHESAALLHEYLFKIVYTFYEKRMMVKF
jgi:hypothetical protein